MRISFKVPDSKWKARLSIWQISRLPLSFSTVPYLVQVMRMTLGFSAFYCKISGGVYVYLADKPPWLDFDFVPKTIAGDPT